MDRDDLGRVFRDALAGRKGSGKVIAVLPGGLTLAWDITDKPFENIMRLWQASREGVRHDSEHRI